MRTFRRLRIGQQNAFGNSTTPDKSKSKSSILEMIKLNPGNLYSLSPSSEVDYEHSWEGSPDFPGKIFMSKRKREVFRRQFLGAPAPFSRRRPLRPLSRRRWLARREFSDQLELRLISVQARGV